MNEPQDPVRWVKRTERPSAGWFTYLLMYLMAFIAGAGAGTFAAFRFSVRSHTRYRGEFASAPENYSDVAVWAIAGGVIAMIAFTGFLRGKDEG